MVRAQCSQCHAKLTEIVSKGPIFALACTSTQIICGTGDPDIKIYSTETDDFPIAQILKDAHTLGCHHMTINDTGKILATGGFGGEVKIWRFHEGMWVSAGSINTNTNTPKTHHPWSLCLSTDGQYLAETGQGGQISVWDVAVGDDIRKVRDYESKHHFGTCIDLSPDGKYVASGNSKGNIYVWSTTETRRLLHSLPGMLESVRAVRFSPGSKLLAAGGDAQIISLYDPASGEQVANLQGHSGWIFSLDWNHTGAYLLSGAGDGKVKVWDIEMRKCVATHNESAEGFSGLLDVKWVPKGETSGERAKAERFVTAGMNRSVSIYREATGG
jgi:superkiller protein 8